ncbi:fructose-1,6-bisphosphatase [Saccharicrinis carchari]|uniref:Fructose-1,6-bisphosphatase n=1 Tax=Saccharicrinis carchari TaxID=1168039 RepID=A0A521DMT4_SACCC|nr:inositol monophosphatase family protein [Saccharicrinis carchari]SMO72915.1 fructose-1,6-bisphosphatase [Saccharicrinis carchari]
MHLKPEQLNKLCAIAINAATEAGHYISTRANKAVRVELKQSGTTDGDTVSGGSTLASQVVTEVDLMSQQIILKHLTPTLETFDLGLLTEESVDNCSRFAKDYFWCVDPLDGTLPFTEGKPGYAVSIALLTNTGEALVGVVFDPVRKSLYHAIKQQGAFKNYEKIIVHARSDVFSFITDRGFITHPGFRKIKAQVKQYMYAIGYSKFKQIDYGGAAMNAIWVMENSPACYFKLPKASIGGGSIWDFAATTCIFKELGLSVSDFGGNKLKLNSKETTFMNRDGVIYASDAKTSGFIQKLTVKF